jgi:putative Mg2+ transporter-C (MgtC) family protein
VIGDVELSLRIVAAAALGASIGYERERNGQAAGMRTHALVATGAALFTLCGAYGFQDINRGATFDPMRVAAQVASGVGFIGAGAILRDGAGIRGLTTAAAVWVASALGVAAAAGLPVVAFAGMALVLLSLTGLRAARNRGLPGLASHRHLIELAYRPGHGTIGPIVRAINDINAQLEHLEISDAPDLREVQMLVRTRTGGEIAALMATIADRPEVVRAQRHAAGARSYAGTRWCCARTGRLGRVRASQ